MFRLSRDVGSLLRGASQGKCRVAEDLLGAGRRILLPVGAFGYRFGHVGNHLVQGHDAVAGVVGPAFEGLQQALGEHAVAPVLAFRGPFVALRGGDGEDHVLLQRPDGRLEVVRS